MILTPKIIHHFEQKGELTLDELEPLQREAGQNAFLFASLLINSGRMERDAVGIVLGDSVGKAYMNLEKTLFQGDVVSMLPADVAQRLGAIPIYKFGKSVTVAMSDPENVEAITEVNGYIPEIDILFTLPDELETAIAVHYQSQSELDKLFRSIDWNVLANISEEQRSDQEMVVQVSNALIMLALKERASDIHIEPKAHRYVVRFRCDGILKERMSLDREIAKTLVSRYKIMSNIDISERRKPQDGRINFPTPIKQIDIRVNTLPTVHGETMVMRLLGSLFGSVTLNLDDLAISPPVADPFKRALKRPSGLILVTGPTGSGKSTTLYAGLNYLASPEVKVLTIEDPVEYEVAEFSQSQVDERAGRTFSSILRSALRQDPDVILVGEARDAETAAIAAEAALTGHLVLTTLHTNSSIQGITRLLDMGVEPYVVAPALVGILAQRLPRKLCGDCKYERVPKKEEMAPYFHWNEGTVLPKLYEAKGCEKCGGTGYKGRIGIHEFLPVDEALRDMIVRRASLAQMREHAVKQGYRDMRYDGFTKVLSGMTSLEEIIRVTAVDC